MVWARTKLLIWDYIFEPVKDIEIAYQGPNPQKFYKKVNELIRTIFNVPDAYVQEKSYDWEKGKDTERFEISWEVNKILDTFSFITIEVDLKGFAVAGEGKAGIKIKPRLITEYPQDTVWQQSILYEMTRRFWHKMFYHKKRMEYLNFGKELITSFESAIKHFGENLREGQTTQAS
ncbi:MAG: hypothetical protein HY513_04425 [Candidatus Aenigmarchaeota archaeon]|nr:hypothetical protein [Candidatus Aenigmarchaeota archaeon]